MLIFLLVILFCVALIITSIGLCLSRKGARPLPRMRSQSDGMYVSRQRASAYPPRGVSQAYRTRNVRLNPEEDQSYRRLRRPSAPMGQAYTAMEQAYAPVGQVYPPVRRAYPPVGRSYRLASSSGWTGADDVVGLWGARFPVWLKLTFISGTIFSLCLLLFIQMLNARLFPVIAIITNFAAPLTQSDSKDTTLYGENLGASTASKSIVRIAQLDQSQYNSPDEYNQWAYSACSAASMTEVVNAYGHNYRITDILKVEAGLHEITPEQGLMEDKGIDRTMAQFGFKMVPLQHATLDGAIAVANQGHPVIVSFANSGYWPGGHILVLRGGDAQNVVLADSSRLNKTVVPRDQFLQWWRGFVALAVPR